jgi:hypothetical protein
MSRTFIPKKESPIKEGFKDYKRKDIGPAAGDWMSY